MMISDTSQQLAISDPPHSNNNSNINISKNAPYVNDIARINYNSLIKQITNLAILIENNKKISSSLSKEIAFYCFLKDISTEVDLGDTIEYFDRIVEDIDYSFSYNTNDFYDNVDYLEVLHSKIITNEKKRSHGQYFTPSHIAELMTKLGMLVTPNSVLDPAGGGSIFFSYIESKSETNCKIIERDPLCLLMAKLNMARKNNNLKIEYENYNFLHYKDKTKYDLIIANPPYIRFQDVGEREETIKLIENEAGLRLSKLINYYALFFFHSISMLKENGRLIFITPSEYLNFNYGASLKKYFKKYCDIESIILFDNSSLVFEENLSSACITILTKKQNPDKNKLVKFIKIHKWTNVDDIFDLITKDKISAGSSNTILTYYQHELNYKEKWNNYFEITEKYEATKHNLVELTKYANVSRGIATGANKYFVLSKSQIEKWRIESLYVRPILEKSLNCKYMDFTDEDFIKIEKADKPAYLLYVFSDPSENLKNYIIHGETEKTHEKYLPSKRKPWYSMEKREVAKIWAGTFSRGGVKFVLNRSRCLNLTTFHGIYPIIEDSHQINFLVAFLNSNHCKELIKRQISPMGGGLDKLQPNDLKKILIPDISQIPSEDIKLISEKFELILNYSRTNRDYHEISMEIEDIFEELIGSST